MTYKTNMKKALCSAAIVSAAFFFISTAQAAEIEGHENHEMKKNAEIHLSPDLNVLVKHFHRLIPDTERYRKASIFPASLTQTDVQCEPLLPKINFK